MNRPPVFPPSGKRGNGAFTLMELLVVVAIMGVVVSGSVMSLSGFGKAKQLTMGGNLTVDLVNQARQNAISHHALTALVLVTDANHPDLENRLFVIEEYDAASSLWTQASRWMLLPLGVLVDSSTGTFASSPPSLPQPLGSLSYSQEAFSSVAYQAFLPDGRLLTSGVPNPVSPRLRLVQGMMSGAQMVAAGTGGAASPNYYDVTINVYTGLPQADRP